jgi:2',3'-cyclic-nucleotide 2'-phosphodiesterase (5'-nucleotidase family)
VKSLRKLGKTFALALAIGSPSVATDRPSHADVSVDPNAARATIVRGTCESEGGLERFTLAHFNDLQARYEDLPGGKNRYGFVAGYLRSVKTDQPATLVLDAGDDYEKGSIAELRSLGETTRRMVQALPIDVRVIGNHDFAYGEAAVLRDVQLSAHPVLAANVHDRRGGSPFLPYVAARVGCVRVGIIGLVTGSYGSDDQPTADGNYYDGALVHDDGYVRVLREQAAAHRGEVDVMIALTHLGLYTDLDLAAQVPDVDVIIGGHTEDLLPNGQPYIKKDGRLGWVFQAGHYGEHVGRADFTFDSSSHALKLASYTMTDVDQTLPYAEDVGRTAHALVRTFAPDAFRPIAIARDSIKQVEMPDLVMRAVRDRWAADALFLGKDAFWSGLPSGPLTLQQLYDAVLVQREPSGTPGFTSLYIVTMSGADLIELRQKSFNGYATILPGTVDPARSYRVAIDKRALEHPSAVASGVTFPEKRRFGGELIDVLDAYARARTARGLTL